MLILVLLMENKLRILMIAPTPFFADRGCHVRILEETKALQRLGHEVIVTTYHCGKDMEGIDTRRVINVPWYCRLEAGPSWHRLYLDALLLIKTFFVSLKFKPDVYHAHLHEGAFIGKILSVLFRKPLLFDYQGSLTSESVDHGFIRKGSFWYRIARKVEDWVDNWADVVVQSSAQVVPAEDVEVLFDGIDTDLFRPGLQVDDLRKELGIAEESRVIAYLGVISKYQGVDDLLEAAAKVILKIPDAHFLILGFPDSREYKDKARELGIDDNVTFTGRVDFEEAPRYLNLADIAAAPKISRTEANQKILCYMACALPTVAYETEVNRKMLGDGGVYAKFGDANSLAEAFLRLLKDKEKMDTLPSEMRQRSLEFSWDRVGERLESIYVDLITESS